MGFPHPIRKGLLHASRVRTACALRATFVMLSELDPFSTVRGILIIIDITSCFNK